MRRLGAPDAAARRSYYARIAGLTGKRKGETEETLRNEYNGVMTPYTAELLGTMLMILMGDGVVANVVLDKTKGHAGGWMVVTTAWALAVFVGVVVAAPYSGAHLNPAVTFAFALTGQFPWERVLPLRVGPNDRGRARGGSGLAGLQASFRSDAGPSDQAGRFLYGSGNSAHRLEFSHRADRDVLVAVHHLLHYSRRDHAVGQYLHVARWTGLGRRPAGRVHGLGDRPFVGRSDGLCDQSCQRLAPRVVHALLPIRGKGGSDWSYAWIPVAAPLCGAALAAWLYNMLL